MTVMVVVSSQRLHDYAPDVAMAKRQASQQLKNVENTHVEFLKKLHKVYIYMYMHMMYIHVHVHPTYTLSKHIREGMHTFSTVATHLLFGVPLLSDHVQQSEAVCRQPHLHGPLLLLQH